MALEELLQAAPDDAREHVRVALGDPHPSVRAAAVRAASMLPEPLAPADLREVLEDEVEQVREKAAAALETLSGEGAKDLLLALLKTETSARVLATMVRVLGALGDPSDYPALLGFLDHDDPRVRANSVEAVDHLLGRGLKPRLEAMVADPSNRVRANAAVVLARFDGAAAAAVIRDMVHHDDKWFRMSAAWAAWSTAAPQLVAEVVPLLDDLEPDVQLQAIRAVAAAPPLDLSPRLQSLADDDSDPEVARYAQQALEAMRSLGRGAEG